MARRRRLTPDPTGAAPGGPEDATMKYHPMSAAPMAAPRAPVGAPPVAQATGESAVAAAFDEVSAALASARSEGRLIQRLDLDAIDTGYLVRDRLAAEGGADGAGGDDEDLQALVDSLRARGQQTPVEAVDLGQGRYGLISGWRRLRALRRLRIETGEPRFATVLALLRRPESAAEAYVAMVEENEIRVGLSYYERARIVARAADLGVFEDEGAALRSLFAAASRAKRSKIGAYLTIFRALDGRLSHPAALPERLGLALARALDRDAGLAGRLGDRLRKAAPDTPADELALIERALAGTPEPGAASGAGQGGDAPPPEAGTGARTPPPAPAAKPAAPTPVARPPAPATAEIAPGIRLHDATGQGGGLTLDGPGVDAALRDRLLDWLRAQG